MNSIRQVKIATLAEDYAGGGVSKCWAQHGVSFYISLKYENGEEHHILFDTGDFAEPVLFNSKQLNLSLDPIESIVLSHSHYDHTGGLIGVLKQMAVKERPVIAHPDVFKKSYYKGDFSRNIGMENEETKEIVEELGGRWTLSKTPFRVMEGVTFMGEIPRVTDFERDMTINLQTEVNGEWVEDQIEDDTAMFIQTPKGIIVVSGCSHSGIVNIVKYAKELSQDNILAVIGGFHLISASEERIQKTAEALKELGTQNVITGHCTGGDAEYILKQTFKKQFQKLYAGKNMEFSLSVN